MISEYEVQEVAEVCHEANRALCEAFGDFSQPEWKDAPDWQRTSACNGVLFHFEHPEAGPSASHENWLKEKQETGWKYGPVKDAEKKEHPCMVPFAELPREQQAKDYVFRTIVHTMLGV